MNSINEGNQYRTKEGKGLIKPFTMVKCIKVISFSGTGVFSDENGNEEEFNINELTSFGHIRHNNGVFDILADYYGKGNKDKNGNEDCLHGRIHLTKNVRSSFSNFRFGVDCLYTNTIYNGYNYEFRELNDKDVIEILFNEIIYGIQPDLQSTSCVGTTRKGIDNNPNYHNGHYFLPNNKDYTVTWCYGKIKIREGNDGGWYSNSETNGRTIFEGNMDWEKYKKAKIRQSAIRKLQFSNLILSEFPEVIDIIFDKIKSNDNFKLSNEFND